MNTAPQPPWVYLATKPRSQYRQLFVKGRNIAAWTLYSMYAGGDEPAMTPEAIAADFDLPLSAVQEAIRYCESNPPEIQEDWHADEALAAATGVNDAHGKAPGSPQILTPGETARIHTL
jgi:uncharacterized protein (DUF433 family)